MSLKWTVRTEPTGNRLADLHAGAFEQVAQLYDHQDPKRLDTYQLRAEAVAPSFSAEHRQRLADALLAYQHELGAGAKALDHVRRLRDSRAVAVVTGQQAGLFGGPLLTLYKALSAVGLAERLERELDRPVVPVFWVASEDHDWAEVNHAYYLNDKDEVTRIQWPTDPQAHTMVYYHPLSAEEVDQVARDAFLLLPEGPAKADVLRAIRSTWRAGDSLASWFARGLALLFRNRGLVLLDPCLPALRELVSPVWVTALEQVDAVQAGLDAAYAAVRAMGVEPAVMRDRENTTLFAVLQGKRYVLETGEPGRLRVRGVGLSRPVSEWSKLARTDPTAFSSNVLLRPVVQDTLLPTLAYVGGPAEIAYHALSAAVFHAHSRRLPPLLLRQRMIWYPASVLRNIAKWEITPAELSQPTDLVRPRLCAMGFDHIEAQLNRLRDQSAQRWEAFSAMVEELGPQVRTMARSQAKREQAGIDRMWQKTERLFEQRHETAVVQLRHVEHWLWTDGHLQERRLCPLNLLVDHGFEWVDHLPAWDGYEQPAPVYHVEDREGDGSGAVAEAEAAWCGEGSPAP